MLVSHPTMFAATDCIGADVAVSDGVIDSSVNVGDGVSVSEGIAEGVIPSRVAVNGGIRMMGVAVTIPGVWAGIGVHTGKG